MSASVPSEPSSIRSGDGPAPEPGSRRDSQTSPPAVTARTDSTRSSMCVGPVAKCPAARVAIQPPRVENSNDCGKKRSVSPRAPSCSSSRGPLGAGLDQRRARDLVDLEHAVQPREVDRHRALERPAHRVHPADHARAAAVRRHGEPRVRAHSSTRSSSSSERGPRDGVGRVREAAAERAHDVAVGGAVRVARPRVVVLRDQLAQRRAARPRAAPPAAPARAPRAPPSRSRGAPRDRPPPRGRAAGSSS